MTAPKISLRQQIEAVRLAETRQRTLSTGGTVRELRRDAEAKFDLHRLNAAARTLEWLSENEHYIRAFQELPIDAREAVLRHGQAMGQMCIELAKREAVAKAGGPAR